jgi:hypothetical protein
MYLLRERFFRLGEDSDITDEHGRPVPQVDGKVLSLRNRLVLRDPQGREVAQVQRKLIAMRPTYQISIAGQEAAEVRKHLFTPPSETGSPSTCPAPTTWRCAAICSTTSSPSVAAASRWRRCPSAGSACATPTP